MKPKKGEETSAERMERLSRFASAVRDNLESHPAQDGQTVANEKGGLQSHVAGRFDLIPPAALKLVAECYGFGATKYAPDNWHRISKLEHLNHALSHINQHRLGDASEPHLVNATVRMTMALELAVMEEGHATTYHHPEMEASRERQS